MFYDVETNILNNFMHFRFFTFNMLLLSEYYGTYYLYVCTIPLYYLNQVISMECSLDETLNTFGLHFETLFRVQCCLESNPAVSVKAITDNTVWSTQYSLPYLTFK